MHGWIPQAALEVPVDGDGLCEDGCDMLRLILPSGAVMDVERELVPEQIWRIGAIHDRNERNINHVLLMSSKHAPR